MKQVMEGDGWKIKKDTNLEEASLIVTTAQHKIVVVRTFWKITNIFWL
jgi:hypothetical protein